MNPKLEKITQTIYESFNPLNNPSKQLLGSKNENIFQSLIDEHTKDLTTLEKERIENEIFGWGPLTSLISRDDLLDIMVQGPDHIYYETSEGLSKLTDRFFCETSFLNFVERLCQWGGILINQKKPFVNAKVESFRLHLVGPPIVPQFHMTFRRHQQKILSLPYLLETGFMKETQYQTIQKLLNQRANMLIIGPTGSGKTTLLNSMLAATPENQRAIIVEDTDEIRTHNPLHSKLLTRELATKELPSISLEDLVKQSLRMRPDRIIIGEVRGKEAKDLMQALATGHSGSMGTLHADDPKQALIRLEMLIQMGAPQWQLEAIRRLIQLSLDAIITLKEDRLNKGILSIKRLCSLEKFGFLLEDFSNYPEIS